MLGKTTEEFQQEILKSIKLRRIGQKRSYLGGPCVYRTKKELSIVRHGEIILYKLDFILSFHPVMTPQFAL